MKKLLYFTGLNCAPCRTFSPIMDRVSNEFTVEKIVTDYQMSKAVANNVKSIPTVILMENDQEVKRFIGAKSYEDVINFYNN